MTGDRRPDDSAALTEEALTAHHEAGHAVAAVMRGGSSLRSIDMSRAVEGHGLTLFRAKSLDGPFIAYAGPWAEARVQWPEGLGVEEWHPEGLKFDDYVNGVFLHQPDDLAALKPHHEMYALSKDAMDRALADTPAGHPRYGQLVETAEKLAEDGPHGLWQRELEEVWPAIQTLAGRLLAGETLTDADVRQAVEGGAESMTERMSP